MTDGTVLWRQNIELEQQILGALLTNNNLLHEIGTLEPDHFYDPVHGEIFRKIRGRIANEHIASPITIRTDMETHEGLKALGGPGYLVRLAGASISAFAASDYASELKKIATHRELQQRLVSVQAKLETDDGFGDAMSELQLVTAMTFAESDKPNAVSFLKAMIGALEGINGAYSGETPPSLKTGVGALDAATGGLWPGDFVVMGGRPSMGKTSLALHIAMNVAKAGGKVAIASAEMTEYALAERALSAESGVKYSDARRGDISEAEMRKIVHTAKELESLPIGIFPDHVRDPAAILSSCKAEKDRLGGLDLLMIDYLQLLRAAGRGRTEQMTEVSIQIKAMAKLLRIPVICLSQLSRSVESRDNKRPILSDLRETGQIEQDADMVLFCYRDYYYLEREPEPKTSAEVETKRLAMEACQNQMEILIAKARMGGLGTIRVGCHLPTNRFWDLDRQENMF